MIGRCLRIVVTVLLLAVGLAAPTSAITRDGGAGPAARTVVTLDGVRVSLPSASRQVVTVNHTGHSRARVTLWQSDGRTWSVLARSRSGHIGYGGLVAARRASRAPAPRRWAPTGCSSPSARTHRRAGWDLRLPHASGPATTGSRTTRRRTTTATATRRRAASAGGCR